jgi:glycosyltransferase involved in cell wall biosynthesis
MQIKDADKFVVIVDSRGIVGNKDEDTFRRHEDYGKKLKHLSPRAHMLIVTASSKADKAKITNYVTQKFIKSNKRFSLKFLLSAFLIIKKLNTTQVVLVAGDPWESGVCAKILQIFIHKFLGFRVTIQVQLHADITDGQWKQRNIVNSIRAKAAGFVLRRVDQIRSVSIKLKHDISQAYDIKEDKLVVCPVALNIPANTKKTFCLNRPKAIGFAGRFHDDRGLLEFLTYIAKISLVNSDFEIVLAGDGPKAPEFLVALNSYIPKKQISFLGHLNSDEMIQFWSKIGVYISTAKSESYGRSIREAAFFGIPVLGLPSNGFSELVRLNVPWIQELSLDAPTEVLDSQMSTLLKSVTDDSLQRRYIRELESNSEDLANSWLRIMPRALR